MSEVFVIINTEVSEVEFVSLDRGERDRMFRVLSDYCQGIYKTEDRVLESKPAGPLP